MSSNAPFIDEIPGFLKAGLIFKGQTIEGERVSVAVLIDAGTEVVVDLENGLNTGNPRLTKRMKSYLTGLSDVGSYLETRTTEDEEGVTPDDIERGALTLAFPRVARNAKALDVLKTHLDALQRHKVIEKVQARKPATAPKTDPRPAQNPAGATAAPQPLKSGESAPLARVVPKTPVPGPGEDAKPGEPVTAKTPDPAQSGDGPSNGLGGKGGFFRPG